MKHFLSNLCVLAFCFLAFSISVVSVFAHVLKSSGSIGAVMHVAPDDDPVAGEESSFFFEFKDKENNFAPENCECTVSVLQTGKEIFTQPLFANNTNPSLANASFSFVFPQRDIYKIKIAGRPLTGSEFKEFVLEYDLRVERISNANLDSQEKQGNSNWTTAQISPLAVGLVVFIFFLWIVLKKGGNKNAKSKD